MPTLLLLGPRLCVRTVDGPVVIAGVPPFAGVDEDLVPAFVQRDGNAHRLEFPGVTGHRLLLPAQMDARPRLDADSQLTSPDTG